jgi:sRNA-binding carbon storage regulator CsrA
LKKTKGLVLTTAPGRSIVIRHGGEVAVVTLDTVPGKGSDLRFIIDAPRSFEIVRAEATRVTGPLAARLGCQPEKP